MILRLALFLAGSAIGALVGYALASIDSEWTEADDADLALEEASMEPYRAALGWNATGEALVPTFESHTTGWTLTTATFAPGPGSWRVLAKADCE